MHTGSCAVCLPRSHVGRFVLLIRWSHSMVSPPRHCIRQQQRSPAQPRQWRRRRRRRRCCQPRWQRRRRCRRCDQVRGERDDHSHGRGQRQRQRRRQLQRLRRRRCRRPRFRWNDHFPGATSHHPGRRRCVCTRRTARYGPLLRQVRWGRWCRLGGKDLGQRHRLHCLRFVIPGSATVHLKLSRVVFEATPHLLTRIL